MASEASNAPAAAEAPPHLVHAEGPGLQIVRDGAAAPMVAGDPFLFGLPARVVGADQYDQHEPAHPDRAEDLGEQDKRLVAHCASSANIS